ncbi:MAG: hypothetical protein ACJ8CF_07470 [Microvirga sp.]
MVTTASIARVAALIGDPTRASMLQALIEGRARSLLPNSRAWPGSPPKPLLPEQARDLLETDHGASQLRCCIVL